MPGSIATACFIGLVLLSTTAGAERLGRGRTLVSVGVVGHTGQFVNPGGATFGRFETGEVGGHLAVDRFVSDHWTLGVSGSYQASRLKVNATNSGGLFFPTGTSTTHSFTVRIGGDRYAWIDDDVAIYAGPGVAVTRGRARDELVATPFNLTSEGPTATELALNRRLGMYARLGSCWGLYGHICQVLSRSSAKDSTGTISWWASTHEGSVGLAFDF